MGAPPIPVALVVGDLVRRGEVHRIARLVGRLTGRGIAALVIGSGGVSGLIERGIAAIEDPWLDRPWLGRVASGRVRRADPGAPAEVVHAMHAEVVRAAAELASGWGAPLVRTIEDYPGLDDPSRAEPRGSLVTVVGDDGLARRFAEEGRQPPESIRVIAPGIDPIRGGEADTEGAAIPGDRVRVIGAMGRLGSGSGFEAFLDAIHRVLKAGRDVEFLVAGLGPGESRLRRRAARLGIAERLTFASPAALESVFWEVIDLYCQPAAVATLGRPLMEAMVAGRPSVAADVEGLRGLLGGGGRGLLVPPGDAAALARAMLDLLDQPLLARSLGERSRQWALPRFDPDREADQLAALYAECARTGSPSSERRRS
ncbi:glycosyltransferase family 4 protein [Tautonia sociabilis]|nr:glycosyltransferase family 4 protein [Tautonia sociabilis]